MISSFTVDTPLLTSRFFQMHNYIIQLSKVSKMKRFPQKCNHHMCTELLFIFFLFLFKIKNKMSAPIIRCTVYTLVIVCEDSFHDCPCYLGKELINPQILHPDHNNVKRTYLIK